MKCNIVAAFKSYGLFVIGLVLTVGWFVLVSYLRPDWLPTLQNMCLNELGDFLAGVFGPVAILWLILGFWQQSHGLQLQGKELQNSVEQLTNQSKIFAKQLCLQKKQIDLEIEDRMRERRSQHQLIRPNLSCIALNNERVDKVRIRNTGTIVVIKDICTNLFRADIVSILKEPEKLPKSSHIDHYLLPDAKLTPHGQLHKSEIKNEKAEGTLTVLFVRNDNLEEEWEFQLEWDGKKIVVRNPNGKLLPWKMRMETGYFEVHGTESDG